jgi:hypothetical protein
MITFLIVVRWFFVVLPYLWRRLTGPMYVLPAPAVTVFTPAITIHVHVPKR